MPVDKILLIGLLCLCVVCCYTKSSQGTLPFFVGHSLFSTILIFRWVPYQLALYLFILNLLLFFLIFSYARGFDIENHLVTTKDKIVGFVIPLFLMGGISFILNDTLNDVFELREELKKGEESFEVNLWMKHLTLFIFSCFILMRVILLKGSTAKKDLSKKEDYKC